MTRACVDLVAADLEQPRSLAAHGAVLPVIACVAEQRHTEHSTVAAGAGVEPAMPTLECRQYVGRGVAQHSRPFHSIHALIKINPLFIKLWQPPWRAAEVSPSSEKFKDPSAKLFSRTSKIMRSHLPQVAFDAIRLAQGPAL